MKNCLFAGTLDPVTKGHIAVIEKCLKIFDSVLVVVGENPNKTPLFSTEERLNMAKAALAGYQGVKVVAYKDFKDFESYLNYLKENDITVFARGIRNTQDFVYESERESVNKTLYPELTTVYLTADSSFMDISSTLVKDKIIRGEGLAEYISPQALELLTQYVSSKKLPE